MRTAVYFLEIRNEFDQHKTYHKGGQWYYPPASVFSSVKSFAMDVRMPRKMLRGKLSSHVKTAVFGPGGLQSFSLSFFIFPVCLKCYLRFLEFSFTFIWYCTEVLWILQSNRTICLWTDNNSSYTSLVDLCCRVVVERTVKKTGFSHCTKIVPVKSHNDFSRPLVEKGVLGLNRNLFLGWEPISTTMPALTTCLEIAEQ